MNGGSSTEHNAAYRAYYEAGYREAHPLSYGIAADAQRFLELRSATASWLQRLGVPLDNTFSVLELGSAMGQLRDVHRGYLGLEFSLTAIQRAMASPPRSPFVNGDMQHLPFKTGSIGAVFSWAAIEHVPSPELVMAEVARVLRPGGAAILAPAWNCRSWTVKRLDVRPYSSLSIAERLEKASIPIRNKLAWRALMSLPRRLRREAQSFLGRETLFDYQVLHPDFSLNLTHVADDDAQACMDPHAAIMFFKTRGWTLVSHPDLKSRLMSRHEPVVVRKPGS
jgi:SAM-dependent methyltransferase